MIVVVKSYAEPGKLNQVLAGMPHFYLIVNCPPGSTGTAAKTSTRRSAGLGSKLGKLGVMMRMFEPFGVALRAALSAAGGSKFTREQSNAWQQARHPAHPAHPMAPAARPRGASLVRPERPLGRAPPLCALARRAAKRGAPLRRQVLDDVVPLLLKALIVGRPKVASPDWPEVVANCQVAAASRPAL